eukprot:COSAG05_NODE_5327_length_1206_cov_1.308943_1_plen_378_part_10
MCITTILLVCPTLIVYSFVYSNRNAQNRAQPLVPPTVRPTDRSDGRRSTVGRSVPTAVLHGCNGGGRAGGRSQPLRRSARAQPPGGTPPTCEASCGRSSFSARCPRQRRLPNHVSRPRAVGAEARAGAMSSQRLRSLHAQLAPPRHRHRSSHNISAPAAALRPADAAAGATADWRPIDVAFSDAHALGQTAGNNNPLAQLSRGDVPAVILRHALPLAECDGIIKRFAETGLLPSSFSPFVRPGVSKHIAAAQASTGHTDSGATPDAKWVGVGGADDLSALSAERMDIGAALGNLGGDPAAFFQSSAEWQGLYKTLFLGLPTQPVDLMYGALASLSGGRKQVCTAYEQPGQGPPTAEGAPGNTGQRTYCPCIYRSHMPG